ncbi:MAG: hypothetical protein DRJ33_05525 [Candidatus Methanomethylicota archaeon]|uniref:Calcineurin-like phosphoesterase domain-containing protein n=1 Tax=Thermoproteota archaeon TaxID=2056631 RepID=A0A497EW72_9CREN|nr:MAG: hypothetical protein DRJ33_05525 [Candidatus Verstraetearchaeota archaeon]
MEILKGLATVNAYPALYLEKYNAVVVADLHIGFEAALEKDGIHIPVSMYPKMKAQLTSLLDETKAERVIFLGDVKHEFGEPSVQEWVEVKDLLGWLMERGVSVDVVRGNHDNYIIRILKKYDNVTLHDPVMFLEDIMLAHGHKSFEIPSEVRVVILAHEHPAISVKDKSGAKYKFKCFLVGKYKEVDLVVIPSFSPLAVGVSINEAPKEELLTPMLHEVDLGEFTPIVVEKDVGAFKFPPLKFL